MTPMDRSRAFGPALWGATLAYCFQNILGLTDWFGEPNLGKLWEAMSVPYDTIEVFYFSWLFNYMGWLLPVLAAAPFAASFCQDWRKRSAQLQALRCGQRRYICSKGLAVWISGGIVSAGGTLLFFGLLALKGNTPLVFTPLLDPDGMSSQILKQCGNLWVFLGETGLLCFLPGGFWALTGLAFSAYWTSAPMALCFPLLVFWAHIQVVGKSGLPDWMNLAFVGDGGFLFVYSPLTYCAMATGLFLAASLVWAGLFYVGVRRRFEHG